MEKIQKSLKINNQPKPKEYKEYLIDSPNYVINLTPQLPVTPSVYVQPEKLNAINSSIDIVKKEEISKNKNAPGM